MANKCPYYQGVCGLDEQYVCYASPGTCKIYKEHQEKEKEESSEEE